MYLKIEHLCKSWGNFKFDGVTLEVKEGEYFVLLGPCGAGKTLLLSTLAGLFRPDAGRVIINNEDITFLPPEKRNIGYLFQNGYLFPHLSVRENIYYGLKYRKSQSRSIEYIFELLDIGEKLLLRRDTINLSGGEARKVALARSLVIRPRLLLVDEPLSFLDPLSQEKVIESLQLVNKNLGITTIHVTHGINEAKALAGRGAVLVDGQIAQAGSLDEIIQRPEGILIEKYWGQGCLNT